MTEVLDFRAEQMKRISGIFITLMWIAKRRFLQLLQPFGLTLPQFITLAALSMYQEPCKMSDLTSVTLHDAATMTGIADRLVHMGLAERFHSQMDRRVVLVHVTSAGLNLIKQIQDELLNDSLTVYRILTDEELAKIEQVFSYVLRQVVTYISVEDTHLDAALSKLELFMCGPTPCAAEDTAH